MAEIVARMPAVAILSKTFLDAPDEETGDLAPSAEDRFAGASRPSPDSAMPPEADLL